MADNNYTEALLEDINGKFDAVLNGLQGIREVMARQEDLEEVKADIKTIKIAVTDTSTQVQDHERRITHLEAKA
ncbi:MAG TPA: hypothetical protein VFW90_03905 [Candidatus Saccharimonadales bacterium]|nr:hypothetical protein [Candidatus Saccharimonadales bacterium]